MFIITYPFRYIKLISIQTYSIIIHYNLCHVQFKPSLNVNPDLTYPILLYSCLFSPNVSCTFQYITLISISTSHVHFKPSYKIHLDLIYTFAFQPILSYPSCLTYHVHYNLCYHIHSNLFY